MVSTRIKKSLGEHVSFNESLIDSLSTINVGNSDIEFPVAIYEIDEILTCVYAFNCAKETAEFLRDRMISGEIAISNLSFVKICDNCDFGSYELDCETGDETLYCADMGTDMETLPYDVCDNHKMIDGYSPDIKILCKNFGINKRG